MKTETVIYVTKYALSQGIFKINAEVSDVDGYAQQIPTNRIGHFFHKNDYSLDLDGAIANAEERRIKKLKSLDRQAKKISSLKFDCV